MKFLCTLILLTFSVGAASLEGMYKDKSITQVSADDFIDKFSDFRWQGSNKRVAISRRSTLLDIPAYESLAYFSAKGKLVRLDAWLYNRGDQGDTSFDKFEKTYEELLVNLEKVFKVKPKRFAKDGSTRGLAYSFMISYGYEVRLLVGYDKKKKRADFLCLVMRNYGPEDKINSEAKTKSFVVKKDNGDVYVDRLPMIDQGPKGYCVPASLARIGQQYGVDVSMHEIAMIANSSSGGGTSPRQAMEAIKDKRARMGLSIRDIRINYKTRAYTAGASNLKLEASKLEDKDRDMAKFEKEVIKRIDRGRVIAWSMMVGAFPEKGVQQGTWGGHMRLIIGYNSKTKEILYSDSWGSGHELKRWPLKYAYIVSTGLYDVIP